MKSMTLVIVILIIVLIALGAGGFYFFNSQKKSATPVLTPYASSSPSSVTITQQPTVTPEVSTLPSGWKTYTNDKYGFEISFPANYKALDDKDNLYGWPDAVVLIYSGGQSYDLPIEVWDTKTEYEAKYQSQLSNLVVKQIGSKFITFLNANQSAEINQVILTSKEID